MISQPDIIRPESRIVVQFSCGAASAVAGKLALAQYGATHDVQFINAFLANEHIDNRRFLADCQTWLNRQITAEGWTPAHDDLYCAAELPRAAAAYILNGANDEAPAIWPFASKWWKPRDARSNYVRAGALILAEVERLDRAAAASQEQQP
ncbi:hypothetical protein [Aquipseudomonas alcaligenes]|uniref:Uncharacterized protein n=1 Tax=Aquipseudomonas alcaligenes (strain ATCC 14909 / DSM 50342 / CCUG 1425 / JCM 20561 / NBRC 14159 / NCIMB 9945 / NCTC 10367 / 1577) TaxID=1215092 RepID=U2ZLW9_AQUA1|nr:hypothetical protein [Pseudomonas alcaligenes]GAD62062.1 hypothetical protein PA6_009_00680 [Pseudomonas alcaligenes NBRC 14159]SUD16490.1 Uncharacterised protein [Pseudomonas alcaligenes]